MYFSYGETEVSYLRRKDKRLCAVIDQIGHIDRAVDTDLFSSVIHHIIGQQISTKAQATIWQRMQDAPLPLYLWSLAKTRTGEGALKHL